MTTLKYKKQNGYEPLPAMVVRKTNAENGNGIGTCSTSSGTALTVSLTGYELVQNGFVAVTFSNDVPASATLNINGKGAKPIIYKGAAITADTIKADDTVMFAYDGTNYVVTSLGGGGGSSVYPEFVAIQLTQSGGSDSALIGATVVVTNDDTSETILSTTWQGNGIAVQVDAGIDYTVTVGNVTDYYIANNTQSYTAIEGLSRNVTFSFVGGGVDLGLPSGTIWASKNIGANYPEAFGLYFSYGNIVGHNSGGASPGEYTFSSANYDNTPGKSLTADYVSGSATYDGATVYNSSLRTPTQAEATELINNTTATQETLNGVSGVRLTSKIAGYTDRSIFIPYSGVYVDSNSRSYASAAYLQMTKYGNVGFRFNPAGTASDIVFMSYGCCIRPVFK